MNNPKQRERDLELAYAVLLSLMIGGGLLLMAANLLGAGNSTGMALTGGVIAAAGLILSRRQR